MRPTITDAVKSLAPNTAFSTENNVIFAWDISEVKSGLIQPTATEITAEITRLESLEPQRLLNIDSLAYLASTDWYVTRFTESGVAVPADVTQARTDARLAIV